MKYIIVGLHSSGKQEVIKFLKNKGVACGKQFSNLGESKPTIYNSANYEMYSTTEIHKIFESDAYIFMKGLEMSNEYFEGLTFNEYDKNQVFVMSFDQVLSIPKSLKLGDVCFVWMDASEDTRLSRFNRERRKYNFRDQDRIERFDEGASIKVIQNYQYIYFYNEDPERVATVIWACIQHPDLTKEFIENYN